MCTVENYEKGEVKELEDHVKMQCVLEDAVRMNVNAGSKIPNLMRFAEKKMNVRMTFVLFFNLVFCVIYEVIGVRKAVLRKRYIYYKF